MAVFAFSPPHSDWLRSTKTEHRKKENYIDAAERASSALARRRSQKTHETEAFACPLNRVYAEFGTMRSSQTSGSIGTSWMRV
jgi:hypothetical protein